MHARISKAICNGKDARGIDGKTVKRKRERRAHKAISCLPASLSGAGNTERKREKGGRERERARDGSGSEENEWIFIAV